MKNVLGNVGYWLGGGAIAAVGVALARVVAPSAAPAARVPLTVTGQLIACAGLVVICVGVSRRLRRQGGKDNGP